MAKIGFIITAGGVGKRMGTELPKQFINLCGRPILIHTLERIYKACPQGEFVVVLPNQWISTWNKLYSEYQCNVPHSVVVGGDERFHSVKNGIIALKNAEYIAVHDGVRPLVTLELIESLIYSAETNGCAIPTIKPVDSMRRLSETGENSPVDRNRFVMVQTPQIFRSEWLRKAYDCDYTANFTDDASVVEAAGYRITLVEGDRKNIKITTAEDLLLAETFINAENNKINE
jgi:2-C-methyl-D-erythritol 4-phosphate cytidylyltransferase